MTPVLGCRSLATRLLLLALLVVGTQACRPKPSEKDCRAAINNVQHIYNQGSSDIGADPAAVIRSCRGNSSQKSVDCMIAAKTEEDLTACEGDVGTKYFDKEVKANEDRMKKSQDPDEATPDEAKPDEATPDEATPDEATPDEATPDDAKTDDAKTDEAKTDEAKTDEAKPAAANPEKAEAKEATP